MKKILLIGLAGAALPLALFCVMGQSSEDVIDVYETALLVNAVPTAPNATTSPSPPNLEVTTLSSGELDIRWRPKYAHSPAPQYNVVVDENIPGPSPGGTDGQWKRFYYAGGDQGRIAHPGLTPSEEVYYRAHWVTTDGKETRMSNDSNITDNTTFPSGGITDATSQFQYLTIAGATPSPPPAPPPVMRVGTPYRVEIQFKNTGTMTWNVPAPGVANPVYLKPVYLPVNTANPSPSPPAVNQVNEWNLPVCTNCAGEKIPLVPLSGGDVTNGNYATFIFNVTPQSVGNYLFVWQMYEDVPGSVAGGNPIGAFGGKTSSQGATIDNPTSLDTLIVSVTQ